MTHDRVDLRLAPPALTAWIVSAIAVGIDGTVAVAGAVALLVLAVGTTALQFHRVSSLAVLGSIVVAAGALGVGALGVGAVDRGPVPDLAVDGSYVTVTGVVTRDPAVRDGDYSTFVVLRARLSDVSARGVTTRVRSPVLVIGSDEWRRLRLGETFQTAGRLSSSSSSDLSAVLLAGRAPSLVETPGLLYRVADGVRRGIRVAHEPLAAGPRVLVPALVDGDDAGMPDDVVEDFQATGLTHLLAVSGANLTLVVGFAMLLARWCGVRGYGFAVLGVIVVVCFVLIARPEPSVLRAAAMGVVALAGLSTGGRRRGMRALCIAVLVLVMVDPWLARSAGFALSTLATGGILLLAPRWSDALAGWLPRWLAEAVAVPLSAQVMCTPLVAVLSGQVSLVAVGANLLVAPAVGPTTVLGLVAGLVATVAEPVGQLIGRLAGVPAGWIVMVADRAGTLDGASIEWPAGSMATIALTAACVAVGIGLPRLLRSPLSCIAVVLATAVVVVRPGSGAGWPPDSWVMVMCDVGQGDAIVLNAGPGSAIVVDVGPDPRAVDRCLDRLGISAVPLVVLTHFHADHVDGLPGVLEQRDVGAILVTALREPRDRADQVTTEVALADAPVGVAVPGTRVVAGEVSVEFIGPVSSGSTDPNDASLVARAEVGETSVLLTGDVESVGQGAILATGTDLDVDVLKVPHHGSADLDPAFIAASSPALALVSVGANNTYGHPAGELVELLDAMEVPLRRTDLDGDIAVTSGGPTLAVVSRH